MAAAVDSPPRGAAIDRKYRAVALAALVAVVAIGSPAAVSGRAMVTLAGTVTAVTAASFAFLGTGRRSFLLVGPAAVGIAVLANGAPASLAWFGICLLAAWVTLVGGRRMGVVAWGAAVILFGSEWLLTVHDPGWAAWSAGVTLTVVAALLVRHQMELVEEMRRLQVDLAERSRAEERTSIARDLHDVIAHSLTVSLLHVSSARLAVEHDPGDASQALAEAERLTRRALTEVRATVGLLRVPGTTGVELPVPSLTELPDLVASLSVAGSDVSLEMEGDIDDVPATTGSTAYRIVQESLTNAARHAPGFEVRVRVVAQPDALDVAVWSAGPPRRGAGMGLQNMAERAKSVGGTVRAGPSDDGWLVRASLPRVVADESAA